MRQCVLQEVEKDLSLGNGLAPESEVSLHEPLQLPVLAVSADPFLLLMRARTSTNHCR
jgi:hypothetical protein